MANCVDRTTAGVQPAQSPDGQAVIDRTRGDPDVQQLPPGDDPRLDDCQSRDRLIVAATREANVAARAG